MTQRSAQLRRILLVMFALSVPGVGEAKSAEVEATAIEAHTRFLADDLLEGREAGTRGYDVAAAYVSAQLAAIGIKPGNRGSYYQPVPLRRRSLVGDVEASVLVGGTAQQIANGTDFAIDASRLQTADSLDARIVFVGWGISAPELGHDDYQGLDVRGKAVMLLEGAPPNFPGAIRAHYAWIDQKSRMAAARGAAAILTVKSPERDRLSPWERARRLRPLPALGWVDPEPSRIVDFNVTLGPALARRLFESAGRNIDATFDQARRGAVDRFALEARVAMQRQSKHEDLASPNVVGVLEGRDAALRSEVLVVSAHLDHVGRGPAVDGDDIYNGTADNAGGVAVMLEVARSLAAGERPRRSVLFLALTAEEKGLLGSEYFVASPTIPMSSIVGVINVDGLMAFHDFSDIVDLGADHSTLGLASARAARAVGAVTAPDPIPERGNLALSDQYPFLRQGVPVLFPLPGRARGRDGTDGNAAWDTFMARHYHQPSDEIDLPWRWDVAARWGRYVRGTVSGAANADRPRWYAGDPLADLFAPGGTRAPRPVR